jgi:hypothetical protein
LGYCRYSYFVADAHLVLANLSHTFLRPIQSYLFDDLFIVVPANLVGFISIACQVLVQIGQQFLYGDSLIRDLVFLETTTLLLPDFIEVLRVNHDVSFSAEYDRRNVQGVIRSCCLRKVVL